MPITMYPSSHLVGGAKSTTPPMLKSEPQILVILYYDHALTLHEEIQRYWIRAPLTWATFFFFLNRYLAFLGHIPIIMDIFWNISNLPRKATVSERP